jgi:hypothetical protein
MIVEPWNGNGFVRNRIIWGVGANRRRYANLTATESSTASVSWHWHTPQIACWYLHFFFVSLSRKRDKRSYVVWVGYYFVILRLFWSRVLCTMYNYRSQILPGYWLLVNSSLIKVKIHRKIRRKTIYFYMNFHFKL